MNDVVAKALRALSDAGIGTQRQGEHGGTAPGKTLVSKSAEVIPGKVRKVAAERQTESKPPVSPNTIAKPDLPDSVLIARHPLAELCRLTLEGNPEAYKLSPDARRWIAEHVEMAVLNWLHWVFKPESAWEAHCPKGHRVSDGIFANALMGWCCAECQQVYPPGDCRLRR